MAKRGRKPKPNAIRDSKGISRGEGYHPETIARRERELEEAGIRLTYVKSLGAARYEERRTALTNLAGFTLGQMYLKWQQNPRDLYGVSEDEYNAGERWSRLVRYRSMVLGYELKPQVASPQWVSVNRGIGSNSDFADPDEEELRKIRNTKEIYERCHNTLVNKAEGRSWQTATIVYSVCIDNIPLASLTERHVRILRGGLGALAKELG